MKDYGLVFCVCVCVCVWVAKIHEEKCFYSQNAQCSRIGTGDFLTSRGGVLFAITFIASQLRILQETKTHVRAAFF
jgi:hypothetical protein